MVIIKSNLRWIVSNAIALLVVAYLIDGFSVKTDFVVVTVAAVVLGLVNFIVKPVLKAISFPINFLTLGFFNLLINAFLLLIVVKVVDGISVTDGVIGLDYAGIIIPNTELPWYIILLISATLISVINWILKKILL